MRNYNLVAIVLVSAIGPTNTTGDGMASLAPDGVVEMTAKEWAAQPAGYKGKFPGGEKSIIWPNGVGGTVLRGVRIMESYGLSEMIARSNYQACGGEQ